MQKATSFDISAESFPSSDVVFVIGYYFVVIIVSRRCVFEFDQVRMRERMTSQLIWRLLCYSTGTDVSKKRWNDMRVYTYRKKMLCHIPYVDCWDSKCLFFYHVLWIKQP